MKKKMLAAISATATAVPLALAGVAVAAPANAACSGQGSINAASVRWWKNAYCNSTNYLTAVTNGNKGIYNSLPSGIKDELSSAEIGMKISMVYVYKAENRTGCSAGFHGNQNLENLALYRWGGSCGTMDLNDDIASMNLDKS